MTGYDGLSEPRGRGTPRCDDRAMTAYAISDVEVLDEAQAQRFRELAAASIAQHRGR